MQQELIANKPQLIFLGCNSKTAAAIIAARPELKSLKTGTNGQPPKCRKLGTKGDPTIKSLVPEEANGAIVIGFNIPSNIAARAERVIEIPIGQEFPRTKLGDVIAEGEYETLAKALASMARIPLKAYTTATVGITQGLALEGTETAPEEEEDSVEF